MDDLRVVVRLLRRQLQLAEQIGIAEDARERRFQVVADVGDQLALHALRAHLVLKRRLHAVPERTQILCHRGEHALRHIGQPDAQVAAAHSLQRRNDTVKAVDASDKEIACREEPADAEHERKKRAAHSCERSREEGKNDRISRKEQHDVPRLVIAEKGLREGEAQPAEAVPRARAQHADLVEAPAKGADAPAPAGKAAGLEQAHERQRKFERKRERRDKKQDRRQQQERKVARTAQQLAHQRDIQACRSAQNAPEQHNIHLDRQPVDGSEVNLLVLRAASRDEQQINEQQQRDCRQRENDINRMRERILLRAPYFLILRRLLGGDAHPDDRAERISSRPDVVFINRLIIKGHIVPRNIALRRVVRPGNQVKRRVLRRAVVEFGVRNHRSVHDAVVAARKIPGLLLELLSGYASLQSCLQRYRRVVHLPGHVARLGEIRFKLINHAVPAASGNRVLSNDHRRREAPHNARKRDELCCRTA